jgi:hypothetical protein
MKAPFHEQQFHSCFDTGCWNIDISAVWILVSLRLQFGHFQQLPTTLVNQHNHHTAESLSNDSRLMRHQ